MELQEWYSLKAGDIIYSGKDSRPRQVIKGCSDQGWITTEILRPSWTGKPTTIFCVGERKNFSLTPKIHNLAVFDLVQKIKGVPEDKRMRMMIGIEDELGNPTKDGLALLMNMLYLENLPKINKLIAGEEEQVKIFTRKRKNKKSLTKTHEKTR